MNRILAVEAALVLLSGLLAYPIGRLVQLPAGLSLFWVGLLLGLTFAPMYALATLGGGKMPPKVRNWLGPAAWALVIAPDVALLVSLLARRTPPAPGVLYLILAPGLFGLLLVALASLRASPGRRGAAALGAAYAYSLPMLLVRWVLVPMVSASPYLSALVLQLGALYMMLHGLLRILWPNAAEAKADREPAAGPLRVMDAVPLSVVGQVERAARRMAHPYATTESGERDRSAISVECRPDEAEPLAAKLRAALSEEPVAVSVGERVGDKVEIVVRMRE